MLAPAGSLLLVLRQIADPRGRQGRRHSLSAMLATVVCALLCGSRSYSAIVEWIHAQEPETWHLLGFLRKPPKLNAFRKLLMRLSPQVLEAALRPWVDQLLADSRSSETDLQPVAMDGKSLRGALGEHGQLIHLLSLLDQRTGFVLRQMEVPGKTNEHKAALELLKTLVLKGRLITGDAIFCQRDLCRQIVDDDGHYFFMVKDNQPELKQAIEAEFRPAFSPLRRATAAIAPVGGRNQQQRAWPARAAPPGASTRLAEHLDWPGVAQVCRIERWRSISGKEEHEVAYAITSAPRDQADAATLLACNRGHWGIENRSHYVRDVTFGEDASQIEKGYAPQILAGCGMD